MDAIALICRNCGGPYDLTETENHKPCPACGAENCRPQAEGATLDMLRRATTQRLRCDFVHAESSYQYVLRESPDEHEALWGLVQCRYGVEYVKDPRTGKPMPIVHAVRRRPMLTDPDFREACDLAPEAIREQYRQEGAYIDGAMAKILALAEKGEPYDIFLCHKTSRTDGVEGYTEDYNRAVQLYIKLRDMGYHVFFAPFAGLTPGESYEAGIYHALATAKVMLVICSNAEYITSPWVRSEWQRFLEMSYEPGADKHLIPLLYDSLPPRRLPDDFRQLQAIAMGELDATDKLMGAVAAHVGKKGEGAKAEAAPEPEPAPKPEPAAKQSATEAPAPAPQPEIRPVVKPAAAAPTPVYFYGYTPDHCFETAAAQDGVTITKYTSPGPDVLIPPMIHGQPVTAVGKEAFAEQTQLAKVIVPEGVTIIGEAAFQGCSSLKSIELPAGMTTIGEAAFQSCTDLTDIRIPAGVTTIESSAFSGCSSLAGVEIPSGVTKIEHFAFHGCGSLTYVRIPESVTSIGRHVFRGCSSLTGITIPESVTSIGVDVFKGCPHLTLNVFADSCAQRYALGNHIPFALIPHAPASASHFIFRFAPGNATCAVEKYVGPGGDVIIPETHQGVPVAGMWKTAFDGAHDIRSILLPRSMKFFSMNVFSDLANVRIRVYRDSTAHAFALSNGLRVEVVD